MHLTDEIKCSIDKCVLCWLASCDENHHPTVSSTEPFTCLVEEHIVIANIASPQSVKNIKVNPKVCLDFIDVIIQKGFQLKGKAQIVDEKSESFRQTKSVLEKMSQGKNPCNSISKISIESAIPIIAPSYFVSTTIDNEEIISYAKKVYGF